MNRLIKTLFVLFLFLVLLVVSAFNLISTAIRSGIYWAIRRDNYWDLSNEWFQVCNEAEMWYKVLRDGWNDY
jgi:predicted PurR-regulated permease PerM